MYKIVHGKKKYRMHNKCGTCPIKSAYYFKLHTIWNCNNFPTVCFFETPFIEIIFYPKNISLEHNKSQNISWKTQLVGNNVMCLKIILKETYLSGM